MAIYRETVTVTDAAGGAGVATAYGITKRVVDGEIIAIYLAYTDSPPAGTTDVIIAEAGNSPAIPILTVSDAATDGWFYPMAQAQNQAGADITNQGRPIKVADHVKVTIQQANNDDGVTATIVWDDQH